MDKTLTGTYVNISSPIHKLNVRYKIACLIMMLALTLLSKSAASYMINFVLLIFAIILSKVNIKYYTVAIKRLWLFCLLIFLMNSFFYNQGKVIFNIGKINLTSGGIKQGLIITINVLLVILWSKIFILTTSPIEITNGIKFYLKPLRLFKIPTENLSLIISVSITFIPILLLEAQNIKKAQTARGAEFESKNILKKAKCIFPLIVPIFINAFKRADELSQALEARGYKGDN